ncbi:hypothetical protein BTM25_40890 [Actinomadura rubteroloni]|uniref:Uncharacterized protein n=1 Tax=Actinomadura rubteroloni TaxID=1926885 RepID=A0A2P4UK59_9ACTN|nr:hypothetical protein BTM25_40890 [Actinomadura rubteroloni]
MAAEDTVSVGSASTRHGTVWHAEATAKLRERRVAVERSA